MHGRNNIKLRLNKFRSQTEESETLRSDFSITAIWYVRV
jgi:hypothetical protein